MTNFVVFAFWVRPTMDDFLLALPTGKLGLGVMHAVTSQSSQLGESCKEHFYLMRRDLHLDTTLINMYPNPILKSVST